MYGVHPPPLLTLHYAARNLQEIEKLRGTVSHLHREASMASLGDKSIDGEGEEQQDLWKIAWEGFRRGFTLTYFVRTGETLPS